LAIRATHLVLGSVALLLGAVNALGAAERPAVRAAVAPALPTFYPVATDTRLGGDDQLTRFVMDFSRKVELRAFTLADPYRVVIDLPQVTFKLPARTGDQGRGLVKAFRFGLVMPGGSRIVLDLSKPVRVDKAFMLDTVEGQPARLVLDLAATDRDSFLRTLALERRPPRAAESRNYQSEPATNGDTRPIIVLDPGHGGIDQGTRAVGGDITEKAIVLEFALLLRDQLERTGKYRIVMTRTDDSFVALSERVKLARSLPAALLISIHADALRRGEGDAQGATVYTVSETASDAEAARLAETENRADVIAGIDLSHEPGDVADILIDLAQRETKTFSMHFAKTVVSELRNVARLHKNPLKAAGFKVLKAPDVPSVLIELGYVSSKDDLKQLTSGAWRTRTAASLVQAIDTFFSTRLAGTAAGGR
jgi:N-acetylmuramoyl-L-alanine amidase